MLIGYARVSTGDQDHALQLDALQAAGCEITFVETASGSRATRPELARALERLRAGDTLVCWRLDRLARSLRHLIQIGDALRQREIGLRSISESLDTTTVAGRFLFHLLGALAEMETELIVERTRAGLAAAAARGRHGGRPPVLGPDQVRAARAMLASGTMTSGEIAGQLGCAISTLYRHLPGGRGALQPESGAGAAMG